MVKMYVKCFIIIISCLRGQPNQLWREDDVSTVVSCDITSLAVLCRELEKKESQDFICYIIMEEL